VCLLGKVGALGPVYRLVGQGFSDRDVAKKLHLTELSVQALHSLDIADDNASVARSANARAAGQLPLRIATHLIIIIGEFL
jgi:hypothetical protein